MAAVGRDVVGVAVVSDVCVGVVGSVVVVLVAVIVVVMNVCRVGVGAGLRAAGCSVPFRCQ